jgi:hypothetical protein
MSSSNVAVYRGILNRGTQPLLTSKHFQGVREKNKKRIKKSYLGLREWGIYSHRLAVRLTRRCKWSDVRHLGKVTHGMRNECPDGYPSTAELISPEIRAKIARAFPTSHWAIDQRVVEAWNFYLKGKDVEHSVRRIGGKMGVGGFRVICNDRYIPRAPTLYIQSGTSEFLEKSLNELDSLVSPFSSVKPLDISWLNNVVDSFNSEKEAALYMPQLLQRWRWMFVGLPGGDIDSNLTASILSKCNGATGLHLLRYRNVYKLNPSLHSIEKVMAKLYEERSNSSLDLPFSGLIAEREEEEALENNKMKKKREQELKKYASKRIIPRHLYPFRQNPKFYFYNPLPFCFLPEPSVFSENKISELPKDADTARLLPDDQRKKLYLLIQSSRLENKEKEVRNQCI